MTTEIDKIVERVLPDLSPNWHHFMKDERKNCQEFLKLAIDSGDLIPKERMLTVEEIRILMALNCECYPADEYKMAEAVHQAMLKKVMGEKVIKQIEVIQEKIRIIIRNIKAGAISDRQAEEEIIILFDKK